MMDGELTNVTSEPRFYIFAFSTSKHQRMIILSVILLIYLIILSGNLLIISLICLVRRLHTPMYFFLCNLSTLDIMYVTTTLPKLMYVCSTGDHVVSYTACMAQMYLYITLADTECFLLTAMAIDRYVAICYPLHYSLIMSKTICGLLAFPAWFMSSVNASIMTYFVHNLTYIDLVEIKNFFCDLKAMMNTSISDITTLNTLIILNAVLIGVIPSCMISASYACIIHTVLKIKSPGGRWKTFSSCSSHITIVVVYYGSAMSVYLQKSLVQDLVLSMMYVTLVPTLNPIVYSLRNRDIKGALHMIIHRKRTWPSEKNI
ncbi:hypothetical protein GDO81_008957 [Engystomops pustulosus]|uniref:Olfactory receptor n=1 Tax=Engystomops pustulosus TaxID=76066 RepID=A0AAV7BN62_ENGPU|nr:hypothetical protein GDO81_008957 [Engystomops pustulosus]